MGGGVLEPGTAAARSRGAGPAQAAAGAWHAILVEYLPFVTLLLVLFTTGGGVLVRGGVAGTPAGNTALLAIGTLLAGVMGTTGAAMVLIHPLLRANAHRQRKTHLALMFILLVANAGGALSPLGDPPLYLGYLRGVPFFWPLRHLGLPLALVVAVMLAVFWPLDAALARREGPPPPREPLHIRGWGNALGVLLVGTTVLVLGGTDFGVVNMAGQARSGRRLISIAVFVAITVASAWLTPRSIHRGNDFSWHPMIEVALLFVAIFITIEPVLAPAGSGNGGAVRSPVAAADGRQRRATAGSILLGDRRGFGVPGQCAKLSRVFRDGWDSAGDAEFGAQPGVGGNIGRRGVLRGADLHRQCAEHDGARDRRASRRADAGLLRVHDAGGNGVAASVRLIDGGVFSLRRARAPGLITGAATQCPGE